MLMKPDPGLGLDMPSARIDVPSRLVGSTRAACGRPTQRAAHEAAPGSCC